MNIIQIKDNLLNSFFLRVHVLFCINCRVSMFINAVRKSNIPLNAFFLFLLDNEKISTYTYDVEQSVFFLGELVY